MLKTKIAFIIASALLVMFSAYVLADDIILIVKQTLDERVAVLERKCAMYDAYFRDRSIPIEQIYGSRIVIITEGQVQPNRDINPRTVGRYMVRFKNGTQMVIVTFEKGRGEYHDKRGTFFTDLYTFHLETGQRAKYLCKDVDDIEFIPYNKTNQ